MTLATRLLAAVGLTVALASPALASTGARFQASYEAESRLDYQTALSKVDEILQQAPQDYVAHLRRGWLLYLLGRYADAESAYRTALALSPNSVEARTGLTLPLMAMRRWRETESQCRAILGKAPGHYIGASRLAYALYSMGRYEEAGRQYQALVDAYPSDVEMRAGLGWVMLKRGRVADARLQFSEVLRTAPEHVSASQGLQASE